MASVGTIWSWHLRSKSKPYTPAPACEIGTEQQEELKILPVFSCLIITRIPLLTKDRCAAAFTTSELGG